MIVVVGAGLAGATAAARLHTLGVPVSVVADRPGATMMHGGGWRLGIERLPRFGLAGPRLGEALDFVGEVLPALALADGPFCLSDTDGVSRLADVAPENHARAASLQPGYAVADLAPVGHPFAAMHGAGEAIEVDYPRWPGAFDRSFAAVATRLSADEAELDVLVGALRDALRPEHTGLLLPPVLGIDGATERRRRVEEALGIPVAEALGTLPSTPGLRLDAALRGWLARLGVPLERGRVTGLDLAAGRVQLGDRALDADGVVLATGGVLTGGLTVGEVVAEPIAGLRIAPELPIDYQRAVHPENPYGGAFFRAGVPVDASLRPTRHDGSPVHDRLFAVGDLLSGPDSVGDRCSSGVALLSGYLVGEHIAAGAG